MEKEKQTEKEIAKEEDKGDQRTVLNIHAQRSRSGKIRFRIWFTFRHVVACNQYWWFGDTRCWDRR